jgi:hypothetical protein
MSTVLEATNHLSSSNVRLSPDSKYVAYIANSNSKLLISDASNNKLLRIFSCVDKIDRIDWSPDSCYILCAMYPRCTVQVFSIADKTWTCRINEGMAGIISTRWCPDSVHILIESDFGIQISIWSLAESMSYVFPHPKVSSCGTLVTFSECGLYMAIGHRIELQDYIGLYSTKPWSELAKFKCRTSDLAQLSFAPSSCNIVATDSTLYYRLTVYSPSGEVISHFEPYQNALGLRSFCFQKCSSSWVSNTDSGFLENTSSSANSSLGPSVQGLLAIGSYDGKVRVLSSRTWELAFVLPCLHTKELCSDPSVTAAVKTTVEVEAGGRYIGASSFETELWGSSVTDADMSILNHSATLNSTSTTSNSYIYKNLKNLPKLPPGDVRAANTTPKLGVCSMSWAPSLPFLAIREESMPRCLWIWNGLDAKLIALIVQLQPISCARWRPGCHRPVLAYCTGTERVYLWSEAGPSWIDIPISGLGVTGISWMEDGKRLLLSGKSSFCICEFDEADITRQ